MDEAQAGGYIDYRQILKYLIIFLAGIFLGSLLKCGP